VALNGDHLAVLEEPPDFAAGLESRQRLGALSVRALVVLRLRGPLSHGNSGVIWLPFGCGGGVIGSRIVIGLDPPLPLIRPIAWVYASKCSRGAWPERWIVTDLLPKYLFGETLESNR
jgi:hypothetical protein